MIDKKFFYFVSAVALALPVYLTSPSVAMTSDDDHHTNVFRLGVNPPCPRDSESWTPPVKEAYVDLVRAVVKAPSIMGITNQLSMFDNPPDELPVNILRNMGNGRRAEELGYFGVAIIPRVDDRGFDVADGSVQVCLKIPIAIFGSAAYDVTEATRVLLEGNDLKAIKVRGRQIFSPFYGVGALYKVSSSTGERMLSFMPTYSPIDDESITPLAQKFVSLYQEQAKAAAEKREEKKEEKEDGSNPAPAPARAVPAPAQGVQNQPLVTAASAQ